MFNILPVIESVVDFNALAHCVDLTAADKHSSKSTEKLSVLASSMFGLNISDQWLHLTFYINLPTEVIEIINAFVPCHVRNISGISEGFISGTLAQFKNFIISCSIDKTPTKVRLIANQFYSHLRERYGIMNQYEIRMLSDKTFTLK